MSFEEWLKDMEDGRFETLVSALTPKDEVYFFLNAREWTHAKRQRSSLDPNEHKIPNDIYNETEK